MSFSRILHVVGFIDSEEAAIKPAFSLPSPCSFRRCSCVLRWTCYGREISKGSKWSTTIAQCLSRLNHLLRSEYLARSAESHRTWRPSHTKSRASRGTGASRRLRRALTVASSLRRSHTGFKELSMSPCVRVSRTPERHCDYRLRQTARNSHLLPMG